MKITHEPGKVIARLAMKHEGQQVLNEVLDELDKEKLEGLPELALRNDTHGDLDDVVVKNVRMFRAEMMSDQSLWLACYLDDNKDVTFWVSVNNGEIQFSCTEHPTYKDIDTGSVFE